ncbi:MAG TPA: hypothetical protein VK943_01465 [Arenibaculum sp.]|nr:hypothetical protein [Arenibaculum sp.]
MPATERVVVLMDPSEKKEVEERARNAGVTTAEYMRRSAEAYDPDSAENLEELEAMLTVYEASLRDALAALDRANAAVEAALARPPVSALAVTEREAARGAL